MNQTCGCDIALCTHRVCMLCIHTLNLFLLTRMNRGRAQLSPPSDHERSQPRSHSEISPVPLSIASVREKWQAMMVGVHQCSLTYFFNFLIHDSHNLTVTISKAKRIMWVDPVKQHVSIIFSGGPTCDDDIPLKDILFSVFFC